MGGELKRGSCLFACTTGNERGDLLVHSRALLRAGAAQGRVHAGSEGQQRAGRQGLMSAHAFAPGHGTRRSSVDWRQTGWSVWPTCPSSPSSPISSLSSSPSPLHLQQIHQPPLYHPPYLLYLPFFNTRFWCFQSFFVVVLCFPNSHAQPALPPHDGRPNHHKRQTRVDLDPPEYVLPVSPGPGHSSPRMLLPVYCLFVLAIQAP